MATADVSYCNEDEDLTTCTICLEQLNIPKYLPCLHTFCESCIATYITSSFEKDTSSINCPVCRSNVSAPESSITPEQWAKRLPLNFLLVGLIEKHKVERPEKICMSCERIDVNKKSKAISVCLDCSDTLCSVCLNCHRINKSSSDHEIVDISKQGIVLKSFKNMCTEHKSKDLELFCVDHDLPCCPTCVSVNHRKCENVLTIEDAASKFRETNAEDKLKNDVVTLLADLETILQSEKELLGKVQENATSQLKTYDEFWAQIEQKMDKMKNNQTKQYQMQFDTEQSKLEFSINCLENKKKTVANTKQILDVTVKEASNVQVMIEVQKIKRKIDQYKFGLQRTSTISEIDFQYSKSIDEVDKMLQSISILNCTSKSYTLDMLSVEAEQIILDSNIDCDTLYTSSEEEETDPLRNVSWDTSDELDANSECPSDGFLKSESSIDMRRSLLQENVEFQEEHVPKSSQRRVHDWGYDKVPPRQLDRLQNWKQAPTNDLQKTSPTTKNKKVQNRENETFEWNPVKKITTKPQKEQEWHQVHEISMEEETVSEKKPQKETTSRQSYQVSDRYIPPLHTLPIYKKTKKSQFDS